MSPITFPWIRRMVVPILVGVSLFSTTLVASPAAAQQVEPAPTEQADGLTFQPQLVAAPEVAVWPGGLAVLNGAILHPGAADIDAPVELIFADVPDGFAFAGIDVVAGVDEPYGWRCDETSEPIRCTLLDLDGEETGLLRESLATWRVTLQVDSEIHAEALELDGSPIDGVASIAVSARGAGVTIAPTRIALLPPEEGSAPLEFRATAPYESDHELPIETSYSVTNLGASAFSAETLSITGAIPPGAVDWEASGRGWDCDPSGPTASAATCRWTGGPIERGESTGLLTIESSHAELTTAERVDGRTLTWDAEAVVDGDPPMSLSRSLETTLAVGASPTGSIVADAVDALVVVAPTVFDVNVDVLGNWLDNATGPVSVVVSLPGGMTLDRSDSDAWACDPVEEADVRCEFIGVVEVVGDAEEAASDLFLPLTFAVAEDTVIGAHEIGFDLEVPGEITDDTSDNRTTVSIVVSEKPEPVFVATLHQDDAVVRDGSPVRIETGTAFGVGAENLGSGVAETGEVVTMRLLAAPGVTLRPSDDAWTCTTSLIDAEPFSLGSWHTCEHVLTADLEPDGVVDPVSFDVVDLSREHGAVSIPIEIQHGEAPAVERLVRGLAGEGGAEVAGPTAVLTPASVEFGAVDSSEETAFLPQGIYSDTFAVPDVAVWFRPGTAFASWPPELCDSTCQSILPVTPNAAGSRVLAGQELEALNVWTEVGITAPDVGPPSLYFERWEVCTTSTDCIIETDRTVIPPVGSTSITAVYDARGLDLAPPSPAAAGLVTIGRFTVTWSVDSIDVVTEPAISTPIEDQLVSFTSGTYSPAGTTSDVQWERCGSVAGSPCEEIAGATGTTYVVGADDVGHDLRAAFTVTSSLGVGRFTTTPTAVQAVQPVNIQAPSLVRSEPSPGVQRWTASPGTWTDLVDENFAYEFQVCDVAGCSTVQTSSAANTYEPTIEDLLAYGADLPDLRVVVRAINRPGTVNEAVGAPATLAPTQLVAIAPVVITPSSTDLVASTSPIVGSTVRVEAPVWAWSEPASLIWERCTSGSLAFPLDCNPIPSESATELTLTADETGSFVRPVSIGTNPWHADVRHVGTAVGPVSTTTPQLLAPVAVGAGTPERGDTLVAVPGTWRGTAIDPLLPATEWTYQWQRCSSALSSSCADRVGETSRFLTVDGADAGFRFRVVETVRTGGGVVASSTSSMSAAVVVDTPDPEPTTDQATSDTDGVCDLLDAVGGSGSTVDLSGRLRIDLGTWSASSGGCGPSTTVDFSGAGFTLDGAISLRNASGTIAGSVVTFTSGSVAVGGDGFTGLSFGLGSGGLTIDLGRSIVTGDVIADGLVGLGLPSGWTGATRVRFSTSRGSQRIDITGVAHAATSSSIPTVGGLPQPSGLPTARVVGSLDSSGDLRLDAEVTDLIELGDADIDLVGSVTRSGPSGSVQVAVAGTLAEPVSLSSGMGLTWAELRWVDGVVSGSATIALGSLLLSGTLTYRSATDWAAAISVESSGGPVTIAPQFTLPLPSIEGTIRRTAAGFEAAVVVSVDRWEVGNGSGLVFDDASFTIEHGCVGTSRCETSLRLSAGVSVDLGAGAIEASLVGSIDPTTGDFAVSAALDDVPTPPGLEVSDVRLVVERVDGELSTDVRSEISVLGSVVEGSLSFDGGNTTFNATIDQWTPIPDGPEFSDLELTYSSEGFTVEYDGVERNFEGRTLAVSASVAAPTWLSDLVGGDLETAAMGSIDVTDGSLTLTSPLDDLQGIAIFDVGGVGLSLGAVELETLAMSSSVTQRLSGDVTFTAPSFGLGSDISLAMTISAEGRGGPGGGFGATVSLPDGQGWSDAFGIAGLDIDRLALSVAVSPAGSTIGMAGEATLPGSMTAPLGIRADTPIMLAASIGAGPQCFAFSIGDGDRTAIDVLEMGLITASEASLVLAPAGCAIGDFVFAPGVSFAFDGTVLGVDVAVSVAFDPIARALAADLVVGEIDLAGVTIEGVELHLESSPGGQLLEFAGTLDLFGARATVEGSFEASPGGADIELRALFEDVTIGGFGIDELDVTIETADAMSSVSVDAEGDFGLLGSDVFVTLAVEFDQGVVQRAEGAGRLVTDISGLSLDLTVGFELVPDQFPTIDFVGSLEMAGLEMAGVDGHISRRGATLHADLEIPGLLDARVGGWIAFPHGDEHQSRDGTLHVVGGVPADAEAGDFRIFAEDVTIGVAGFGLRADVEAELLDGNPRVGIEAELQLGTSSALGGVVTLSGTVDGENGIDLAGTGSVTVAEHELVDGDFTATVTPGGRAAVTLRASIDLGGGSAVLDGSFERGGAYGTLFRMYGRSNVSAGSFDFSDVELLAVRDVPQRGTTRRVSVTSVDRSDPLVHPDCANRRCSVRFGFVGSATLAAPAIGEVNAELGFSRDSVAFSARTRLSGPAGDVLGNPTVTIAFDSNAGGVSVLTFRVRVGSRWGVPLGFVVAGTIRSDGSASFDAAARMRGHWEINVPFFPAEVKFWTRPSFTVGFDFDIQDSSALDIRATIDAKLVVLVQWVSFAPSGFRSGWSRLATFRVQGSTKPRYLRVSANVGRLGTVAVTFR